MEVEVASRLASIGILLGGLGVLLLGCGLMWFISIYSKK
jgi:hypothetical protein